MRIVAILMMLVGANPLFADDHTASGTAYGMAFEFRATNPAAVAGSMQSFMASEYGHERFIGTKCQQWNQYGNTPNKRTLSHPGNNGSKCRAKFCVSRLDAIHNDYARFN